MTSSQHARPLWLGFLAASLMPAACILVYSTAKGQWPLAPMVLLKGYAFMSLYSIPVSAIVILVAALPMVMLLKRLGRLSDFSASIVATLVGTVTWAFLTWLTAVKYPAPSVEQLAEGAAIGLVCGLVFSFASGLGLRSRRAGLASSGQYGPD